MTGIPQAHELNRMPLNRFAGLFSTLASPELDSLPGYYRGVFFGPRWLRAITPRGLGLIHLGGWWGKELAADCTGVNLLRRGDGLKRAFPLRVAAAASVIDGGPVVAVHYLPECPFPWPHVIDELRRLDDERILGMTVVPAGLLCRMPLPFLLVRTERPDGL